MAPPASLVPEQIANLLDWLKRTEMHQLIKSCIFHYKFEFIHPFADGIGRTARLLLNFELMKCGYTPIIITNDRRAEYYEVLDLAHTTMDYGPFISLVSEFVVESEELWLTILS